MTNPAWKFPPRPILYSVGFLSVFFAALSPAAARSADVGKGGASRITPALRTDFDAYLDATLARYEVPGAALAVVENGAVVYAKPLGNRTRHRYAAVDAKTLFMIGSVTKSMTSMMMASLVERGKLDWNTKVTQILPNFALSDPQSTAQIRVRDLVNHSSGVSRFDLPLLVETIPPKRMIASLAEIPVVAPPGQTYNYSNQMYATGGFVAALATGAKYEDRSMAAGYSALMQERVFDPIGMCQTTLDFEQALRSPNHAWPHAYDPLVGEVVEVAASFERFAPSIAPAGAVWSNLDEMASYAITQMGGVAPRGNRVISESALQVTQTTEIQTAPGQGYAMGWGTVDDPNGQRVLMHDGGTAGFSSLIVLLPDLRFGIVILTNNRDGGNSFCAAALNYVFEGAFGLAHQGDDQIYQAYQEEHAMMAEIVAASAPVTWLETRSYLGSYQHHVRATFEPLQGFTLQTEFGGLPMISLAQFGEPGVYVTGGAWTGLVARFSQDALALGTINPEDRTWTLDRLASPPRHHRVPAWQWPNHIRHPAFRPLLR
jgi:CubicO group peptidase (beta-lactamase class C family)